jgi:dolichyl-diphosphooligosaccharide--protein glycosyltransferase
VRRTDLLWLAAILIVAAGLRVWAPWDDVFPSTSLGSSGATRVNFLETDAWYHVRLVQNQVVNYPHRVTIDPYASPDGQYVAVAPLLDTIIATAVVITDGRGASAEYIERVAALVPAAVGVLAVAAVWALATLAFDRRAGLIAGLLAAVLPGHFLDRTLVGFVDHHALEVLLSIATLAGLVYRNGVIAGTFLGWYLLAWASGSYFVAILIVWIGLTAAMAKTDEATAFGRVASVTAAVALAIVLVFQDPALFRYGTQVAALAGLLIASLAVTVLAGRVLIALAVLGAAGAVAVAGVWVFAPDLVQQVVIDLNRFRPDPTRMAVLEARPLFLYSGNWLWSQPWIFFRSGFYAGAIAVLALAASLWRSRRADHLLIVCFTLANFLATLGQNRFGYYLVPSTAVVCGWLAARIFDWGGVPHADNPTPQQRPLIPLQREIAVIAVAGLIIAPNLVTAAVTTTRVGGMPGYWFNAMQWLRQNTPDPFGSPDYYLQRYDRDVRTAAYSIMNWWDQGYWIIQTALRVPVANPTQGGAPAAAAFLTATDEAQAMAIITEQRARFVLVDFELPFREGEGGALAGRFQNLADWAGIPTSRYYSLCFTREGDTAPWRAVWLFNETYYQTLAYRLMVAGGLRVMPANNTYVVETRQRTDVNGRRFCELMNRTMFATPEEAKQAAAERGANFTAVGLTPWQPAFPVEPVRGFREVASFGEPTQQAGETPLVRIFEVVR